MFLAYLIQSHICKSWLEQVNAEITRKQATKKMIGLFLAELEKREETVTEFTEELWLSMLDFVTAHTNEDIRFTFKNGIEFSANCILTAAKKCGKITINDLLIFQQNSHGKRLDNMTARMICASKPASSIFAPFFELNNKAYIMG